MIDLSSLGQGQEPGGLIGVILRALGLLKGSKSGGIQSAFSDMPVSRGRVFSGVDRKPGNPLVGPGSQVREARVLKEAPT